MKTRAAIAFEAKKPLEIVELDLEGPRPGEVLVEIMATGICHTDAYTLEGKDSEGIFPSILGHEGAGIVREVGKSVTSVKAGDHVIPLYTPECRQCKSCLSQKTNLCTQIRATQGKGLMPDGTSRFSYQGKPIYHYMGCSTFSNFTVLPEIAVAKIREDAPFDKSCYIGCGVTTGVGAVVNTAKVTPGANVVVFGLGGIGLNVIQGAKMVGADKIVGVDINDSKEDWGRRFGMTHFVNPTKVSDIVARAGVTQPAFYFYFPSKQAIYDHLLKRAHDELLARLRAARPDPQVDGTTVPDMIRGAMEGFLRYFVESPSLANIGYFQASSSAAIRAEVIAILSRQVAYEQGAGYVRRDLDRKNSKTEEQIATKFSSLNSSFEILVGCSHNPYICWQGSFPADAIDNLLFNGAQ